MRDLTPAQEKHFIDLHQTYLSYLDSVSQYRHSYLGSMTWKTVNGADYLYRLKGGRGYGRSLGRKSAETEAIYRAFKEGKQEIADRIQHQTRSLGVQARVSKALYLGRAPAIAGRIVREINKAGLDEYLTIVGTNALYGYESLAACRFDADLMATTDMDLLWDSRIKLKLTSCATSLGIHAGEG